jgi:hypothetical protein
MPCLYSYYFYIDADDQKGSGTYFMNTDSSCLSGAEPSINLKQNTVDVKDADRRE